VRTTAESLIHTAAVVAAQEWAADVHLDCNKETGRLTYLFHDLYSKAREAIFSQWPEGAARHEGCTHPDIPDGLECPYCGRTI
jgi:hypothetical protein